MLKTVFCLRIDLDSAYGTARGVPALLEALRKNDAVASFFVPLGGESNLIELLSTSGGAGKGEAYLPEAHPLPLQEKIRMALLPKNYAEENKELLLQAMREGHAVGCHGWKHREWTRSLDELDLEKTFEKMAGKYRELFGFSPASFAAPGFKWNERVLGELDKHGFHCAGDLPGDAPFRPVLGERKFSCVQVPVNVIGENTRPIIEELAGQGMNDEKIIEVVCQKIAEKESQRGFACVYAHDFFECTLKTGVLGKIIGFVKASGIEFATVEKAAANCREFKTV